jgi:hypothetical protein
MKNESKRLLLTCIVYLEGRLKYTVQYLCTIRPYCTSLLIIKDPSFKSLIAAYYVLKHTIQPVRQSWCVFKGVGAVDSATVPSQERNKEIRQTDPGQVWGGARAWTSPHGFLRSLK